MREHEELIDDGSAEDQPVETPVAATGNDQGDGNDEPSPREIAKQLKELRSTIDEQSRALEYWRGKAEGRTAGASADDNDGAAQGDDDEEIALEDDLVDAISSNDAKRVAKALKGMGFVREKDVQQTIAQTRNAMTREASLVAEFPALQDQKSEFYQATTRHYAELVREDPALKKSPATLRTAAKLAKAELGDAAVAEEGRAARVSRQSGGGSTRQRAAEGSGELSAVQRTIIANLRAAGANISEDGYKKRASGGVRMAGMGRGR